MTSKDLTVTLNSGSVMPMVGLGTNGINGFKDILEVLDYAFEAGYRLIDTAAMYSNEGDIGRALKELLPKYNLSRKDIFITTKLHPQDQGQKATRALRKSLERLDCEYIDLYLINWPGSYGISSSSKENATLREKSWELMVEAVNEGLVKNIGVSSYTVKHLKKLLSNDYGIKPCINQIEFHPQCYQKKLLQFCDKNGIMVQAYQSFGGTTDGNMDLLEHPVVVDIANRLEKSSGQVLLRWAIQQNIGVIPKSKNKSRIISNMELDFIIPDADMKALCSFKKQIRYDWDPESVA
ncbi:uncharacterized oxidoreductase YtbE isoform X1 [Leptinotarsa decemlineata]|uniref:uncharacterized oxidoreductase YtbE isoform X1 n=1 Tax=Leptinotarsa decemlineata TaxID=7539 RepID=UPI003D304ECC